MDTGWILAGIAVLLIGGYIAVFNLLVASDHKVKQAWSGIDVQLKRRHDLIPKLVETVKAYARYEQATLAEITAARSVAVGINQAEVSERSAAEGSLSSSLSRLFALAEAYPDLKANRNYLQLQQQISETEDQIAAARRIYNANVNELNVRVNSFPVSLVASLHRFSEAALFKMEG